MALDADPYRTLGLKRGAHLDEVKRAYRRLAKINHPDAAGESALPRFLAIQAAYEQLAGPASLGKARRPTPAPRRPWDAEADKTRRAYGGRSRNAPPGAAGTPGGATGKGGAAGTSGGPNPSGAAGEGSGGWARRPGSAGRSGGASARPGRRRTYEPRPNTGTPGAPPAGGQTRPPNKATFGSTSYDGADTGPFEPDWGGAGWYGTTSGTYWTVNPKEYADPRKHGPEYQARARRSARGVAGTPRCPVPASRPRRPVANPVIPVTRRRTAARRTRPTRRRHGGTRRRARQVRKARTTGPAQPGIPSPPRRTARPPATGTVAIRPTAGPGHGRDEPPPPDLGRAAADITRALTDERFGGMRGRLARALDRLAADRPRSQLAGRRDDGLRPVCRHVRRRGGWADALLHADPLPSRCSSLLPAAASIATMAALSLLVAAVVASLVLSATGGAADGDSRRTALGLVLLLAWLAGLAIAVGRRARILGSRASPVS